MSQHLFVEKVSECELALRGDGLPDLRLQRQVVNRDGRPAWEIVHEGAHLFSGLWLIVDHETRQPLAGSSYLSTSFRYGEDLSIRRFEPPEQFLFRRVDPDQDRWLLLTIESEMVLQSLPPDPGAPGRWELEATGRLDPEALLPIVCLLCFDRLSSGRL